MISASSYGSLHRTRLWLKKSSTPGAMESNARGGCGHPVSACSARAEASRHGRARGGVEVAVVEAEVLQHRCRDITLRHVGKVPCFAHRRSVRTEDGDPDVLAALYARVVVDPVDRRSSSTVVRRDDQRRPIAVSIKCLNRAPELRQLTVDEMQVIEDEVVAARVRPVVRLSKTQPEDTWLVLVEIGKGNAEGERVIAAFSPGLDDLLAQRGQLIHLRRAERGRHRFEGTVHEERAVAAGSGHLEAVPGADLCDLRRLEAEPAVRVVEYRLVRIPHQVVRKHVRLRLSGEHLGISGVGEPQRIAYRHLAAACLVAKHHPGRRQRPPEPRHERRATLLGCVAPVALARDRDVLGAGTRIVRGNRGVHAREQLLDPHAVERNQDHVSTGCFGRSRTVRSEEADEERGEWDRDAAQSPLHFFMKRMPYSRGRLTVTATSGTEYL